jgi:hypothetical protein
MTEKQLAKTARKLGVLLDSGLITTNGPMLMIQFEGGPRLSGQMMASICHDYLDTLRPNEDE